MCKLKSKNVVISGTHNEVNCVQEMIGGLIYLSHVQCVFLTKFLQVFDI